MTFYNTANSKLPRNWIRAITSDGKGNAWIGTDNGLAKFDGVNWEIFQFSWSGNGLPGMYVHALDFDPAGNLWIGSYGLAKFDGTNWTVYQTDNSGIPGDYPDVVAVDKDGTVWLAEGSGLTKFDGTNWTIYDKTNSDLPGNWINAIATDQAGNIWASAAGHGLAKFDGTNWTIYSTSNSGLPNNNIQSLHIDSNEILWIGTENGLVQFDGTNWTVYQTSNSGLPVDFVSAIITDESGNNWIGMGTDYSTPAAWGLARFDGTNWKNFDIANSGIPGNNVISILIDKQKNKWIGTSNGLARFDGAYWTVFNEENSELTQNSIWALAQDANGKLLLVAGGDLAIFDHGNWTNYSYEDTGLDAFYLTSLAIDGTGNIWMGTGSYSYGDGLIKFDGTTWTRYDTTNSELPDNAVHCVATDASGKVWLGTDSKGLVCFDGTNWTVYNSTNSDLPYNNVRCLAFDTNGNLWIGTKAESGWDGSVTKFDGTNWTVHSAESTYPNAISIDENGDVWVATNNSLLIFDGNDWSGYDNFDSGLPDRDVNAVAFDDAGNKWIGTRGGLVIFKQGGPANAKIAVAPDLLNINLAAGDRSTQSVVISNAGGRELNFGVSVENSQSYALNLDGVDDYVTIANPTSFDFNKNFTWSAWIKTGMQVRGAILSKTNNEQTAGVKTFHLGGDGSPAFHAPEVGSAWGIQPVNDNQWHHVVMTVEYNGDATFQFYIDGIHDNQCQLSNLNAYSETGFEFQIGYDSRYPGVLFPFSGMIDEVRVWNKVRTLAEIQADMYRELSGNEPGLVGYWRFDETGINITYDLTSGGNHGSLEGGISPILTTTPLTPAWLSATPMSGTVPAGAAQNIEITFDAADLLATELTAMLEISSNDFLQPKVKVPLQLTVHSSAVNRAAIPQIPKTYQLFQNFPKPF